MKKLLFLQAVIILCYLPAFSQASADATMNHSGDSHVMLNAGDLKWMDAPPSLPKGAQFALLSGDPAKPGPFTLRLKMPANYKVPPHWHPTYENVVVLEGTFMMGSGDMLDESKTTALQAGGYSAIPPKAHHFAMSKDGCVIQVNGEGPFEITYLNPADDPRTKK